MPMDMKDVTDWASRKSEQSSDPGGKAVSAEDQAAADGEYDPAKCVTDIREIADDLRELTIEGVDVEALATKLEEVADEIEGATGDGEKPAEEEGEQQEQAAGS